MPWSVADVDKHKKGLTPSQKKEWVKIANKVYKECIDKGGTDKTCAPKAIRVANSKFSEEREAKMELRKVPISAFCFHDVLGFAKSVSDEKDNADILAYSGKPMDHWWFGKLVIDVNGGKYDRKLYPILEDHDTGKKIAFSAKPLVESNALRHKSVNYVSTPESEQFRNLSGQGFPYQASISIRPLVVEELKNKESSAEVNGFKMVGPASIVRSWEYRETSVTVFGADSRTKARSLSDNDPVDVVQFTSAEASGETTEVVNIDTTKKEVKELTFQELKEKDPKGYESFMAEAKNAIEVSFKSEIDGLKTRLEASEGKNREYEKKESIRHEKEQLALSESLWDEALKVSAVPEHLHPKVKAMVPHSRHMKDGSLDVTSFKEAVSKEIKDWVDAGVSTSVMGLSVSQREVDAAAATAKNVAAEDTKWINNMLTLAGQPQASN